MHAHRINNRLVHSHQHAEGIDVNRSCHDGTCTSKRHAGVGRHQGQHSPCEACTETGAVITPGTHTRAAGRAERTVTQQPALTLTLTLTLSADSATHLA